MSGWREDRWGVGVIPNDFHQRKDLALNICALYTEAAHRGRGIAGRLLDMAVNDLKAAGIPEVYLITTDCTRVMDGST
ncbi:GNAT family N-acetyltransferase [Peptoniphilus equinus]|uniref:GNAT family N-acetyltransferase n=1 Tax=Peptoniphilus equinus TaxID=3016343 RepID=A0ABY7QTA3_9FIRM|nr:GNAT family N-acetyltransferase [Peptoniphilus equinus]WBW49515.1 GNAT family N-acetyltransferase [Peptoniphilus equinus]